MTFKRVKKHLGSTPSDFERGNVTPPKGKSLNREIIDEARRNVNTLAASAEIQTQLARSTRMIQDGQEWGPAADREVARSVHEGTQDLSHFTTPPQEAGHAD